MADFTFDSTKAEVTGLSSSTLRNVRVEVQGAWDPDWATIVHQESIDPKTVAKPRGCSCVHTDGTLGVEGGVLVADFYNDMANAEIALQWVTDLVEHANATTR